MKVRRKKSTSSSEPSKSNLGAENKSKVFSERIPGSHPACELPLWPHDVMHVRGFHIRKSNRWTSCKRFETNPLTVCHIDRLGRFTGIPIARWNTRGPNLFATYVSTIASRWRNYLTKHCKDKDIVRRVERVLTRSAAYYVLSKNSYFVDRVLFILRTAELNWKLLHKVTLRYVSKLSDNKRFVYGQASFQAYWLFPRGSRKTPRDKLHFRLKLDSDDTYSLGGGVITPDEHLTMVTIAFMNAIGI